MAQPFQFDEWDEDEAEDRPVPCLVCEAMCPDAVDGTLSEAERRAFDKHVAGCAHCTQELEDAQRGAAWLGLLKSQAPEPPATLLSRILAETTGAVAEPVAPTHSAAVPAALPALASGSPSGPRVMPQVPAAPVSAAPVSTTVPVSAHPVSAHPVSAASGSRAAASVQELPAAVRPPSSSLSFLVKGIAPDTEAYRAQQKNPSPADFTPRGTLVPFRRKVQIWIGEKGVSALHPRLAMTAAMAFFSIALTLNLTGVRLSDLRAENFRPTALQRTAVNAEATAVRSFQSLRVVYQVESRVSELRQDPFEGTKTKKSRTPDTGDGHDSQSDTPGRN